MLLNTRIRRRLPESKIIIAVVVVSQLLRSSVRQQAFACFSCFRAARIFDFFVKLSKTARLATGNNQSSNHDPGSNSVSHIALYAARTAAPRLVDVRHHGCRSTQRSVSR